MQQISPGQLDVIIFDVEHGNCAFLQTPTGETVLLDCGNTEKFSPLEFIKSQNWVHEGGVDMVIISHSDLDHISDLKKVKDLSKSTTTQYNVQVVPISMVERYLNPEPGSLASEYMEVIKYPPAPYFRLGDIKAYYFRNCKLNDYGEELDPNYYSTVTFFEYGGVVICFPGDINNKGLSDLASTLSHDGEKSFDDCLKQTNIFIAPHHGRVSEDDRSQNTELSKILLIMKPDIVIASDKAIQGQNENTAASSYFGGYVPVGKIFSGGGLPNPTTRKVLTTRQDNTIHIQVPSSPGYTITLDAFRKDVDNFKNPRHRFKTLLESMPERVPRGLEETIDQMPERRFPTL